MERPILFSGPMVRALLDGRKAQTRRVVKNPEHFGCLTGDCPHERQTECDAAMAHIANECCPYGVPGDLLWVREEFSGPYELSTVRPGLWDVVAVPPPPIWFWADGDPTYGDWTRPKPSIHMPRWASRITLRITDVRVERLQNISEADAIAEGLAWVVPGKWSVHRTLPFVGDDPRLIYRDLWNHINGTGSWDANPWVWAVSFERVAA